MSDEFKMSDFDTPPDDPSVLLAALRDAAASGVQSATRPLIGATQGIERQIADLGSEVRALRAAAANLDDARRVLAWDRVQQLLIAACALGVVLAGAGAAWHFIKAPKIEEKHYGCTQWSARKQTCDGDWMPLTPK